MARKAPPKNVSSSVACSHLLSSKSFLAWRLTAAMYFWIVFIWSQIAYNLHTDFFGKTFIYLTIQTLVICLIYMTLALYVSYFHFRYIDNDITGNIDKCHKYCKYTEKMQIFATTLSLTVVISFWALLWQYADMNDPVNIQVHGTTMIFTIIDYYLSYSKMKFKSTFFYILIFGVFYIIWSMIYNFATNEAIYPVLDWKREPLAAFITSIIVAIVSLSIHLFLCWSNNKLISRYYLQTQSQFIALAENINNDADLSKDITADYGTQQQTDNNQGGVTSVIVTTTND